MLRIGERTVSEADLLADPGVVIVLSEPGAGKTTLLDSVADRLGGVRVRASTLRPSSQAETLVVDAFDEVARVGDARVHSILDTIRDANPSRVLLSSRSGEWEDARTRVVRDFLGCEPLVAQLVPLDGDEQRLLYGHLYPDRSFEAFHAHIVRFDLHHLLGNPEFLRLFAGAYDEANGRLPSRGEIFTLAIQNLARESNPDVTARGVPQLQEKMAWANEIFAKLLLAGMDGLAVGDIAEDNLHPQLGTIGLTGVGPPSVFDTRLFRPGAAANQHEPVHRIVAEYGAGQHLARRIDDPSCRLTFAQCLALIAPNGVTRDDLRGLLGWMAALGSQSIQDSAIELDPYAVLSNGDPSRLTLASKSKLISALAKLNVEDPYFRRSDRWRVFSASGFFTDDVVDAIRPILVQPDDGHLRELLLELLVGSPAVDELRSELETILLDDGGDVGPRLDALSCLLSSDNYESAEVLGSLIVLGSADALRLAAEIIMNVNYKAPYGLLRNTMEAAIRLYPTEQTERSHVVGERYFLKRLVREIPLPTTCLLLNDLTAGLHCTCRQQTYDCYCREGVSKISGLLLDHYFEQADGPHDPDVIWQWMRGLHFHSQVSPEMSRSVEILEKDHALRRALQERALAGLTTQNQVWSAFSETIGGHAHSGLHLRAADKLYLIDLAYRTDNSALWIQLAPLHDYWGNRALKGPDELRKHCRKQAHDKPILMREWARSNRYSRERWEKDRLPRFRFEARRRQQKRRKAEGDIAYFHANRAAVENGEHAHWTQNIARAYLTKPAALPDVTYDLFDPEVALRRSLQTLRDRFLSIEEIGTADLGLWAQIFLAGAIAEFRATGTLEAVAPEILRVILPESGGYETFAEGELDAFLSEVRGRIFLDASECETFAREYFEPSFVTAAEYCHLHLLNREPALNDLRASLPLEWLSRFTELPYQPLEALFEMAARFGDRDALTTLIRERCVSLDEGMLPHRLEKQRPFWFLRDFWFSRDIDANVWEYMTRNPDFVFALADRRERGREGDEIWTRLSSPKIERVLLEYLRHWPAVPLPSSWGTGSRRGETAYRYLRDLVWQIGRDDPAIALPVVERLLREQVTTPSHNDLRSIQAELRRKAALPASRPGPADVAAALDVGRPASVEQLRALALELLEELQKDVLAGDSGVIDLFYDGDERLGEVKAMSRIATWLRPRLHPFGIHEVAEHQLGARNRCDLTATRMVEGQARMLVIEGKGQWHPDLFSAAVAQLAERYSMHQFAYEQGIFLVVWYGSNVSVAGLRHHGYASASDLREAIYNHLPDQLRGRIDVFVLDVSRASAVST